MTVEPLRPPFRAPLNHPEPAGGVSGSLESRRPDWPGRLQVALGQIQFALEELRIRVRDHDVPNDSLVRRIYQIEAAVAEACDSASEADQESVRAWADVRFAHMLVVYEVGRESAGAVVHVCDLSGGPRKAADPGVGEVCRPGLFALCGTTLDFVVPDLSRLRPGPLCPDCSVAFTSFILDETNRTTWAADMEVGR